MADPSGVAHREKVIYGRVFSLTINPIPETRRLRYYCADITVRKEVEAALRDERNFITAVIDTMSSLVVVVDFQGQIVRVNRAFEQLTGYTSDETKGLDGIQLLTVPEEAGASRERARRLREDATSVSSFTTLVGKNGTRFRMEWTTTRILNASGRLEFAISTGKDVTESHRLGEELRDKEEQMRTMSQQLWQSAKLATMGELAASIAHELNNPLFTVMLRVEALLARMPPEDPGRRGAEIVEQEVKRMSDLVAHLLQFSRRAQSQISTVNLHDEIDLTLELVHFHLRNRRIEVAKEFPGSLQTVQADRQQLRQLFLNLIDNATDAMPEGGRLTIRALNREKQVVLEISDTGHGIPDEIKARLSEPFFTTKPEGKGTGLGLAICRRVVQEHHGTFEIFNGPDIGATARVVLPATNGKSTSHPPSDADRTRS